MIIYTINELTTKRFDEQEFNELLDTNSLLYSIIIAMFEHCHIKKTRNEILRICKHDVNWFNRYTWTYKQRNIFLNKIATVFKNVYVVSDYVGMVNAQNILSKYGFRIR